MTQPECWPDRRLVAFADIPVETGIGSFLDKPWFDVGPDGEGGKQIWITYSDFANDPNAPSVSPERRSRRSIAMRRRLHARHR